VIAPRWPAEIALSPQELLASVPVAGLEAIVFASGSFFDGFGNCTSDVDLFVVADASVPSAHTFVEGELTRRVAIVDLPQLRLDIEFWDRASIHKMAHALAHADPDDPDGFKLPNAGTILDFAHRLKIGYPLTDPGAFALLHESFDFGRAGRFLSALRIQQYQGALEDADGAARSGRFATGALRARSALFFALDAYLARQGETYANDKWVYEKLIRQHGADSDLFRAVWAVDHAPLVFGVDLSGYVDRCLTIAADLALCAQNQTRYRGVTRG
jgi:hypothetical protein